MRCQTIDFKGLNMRCAACNHDVAESDTNCPNCGASVMTRASITLGDIMQSEAYKPYKVLVAIVLLAGVLLFLLRM
jgi:predicted RNA-binding Zn-ribbon protein involved in translation (DUF1610 family)